MIKLFRKIFSKKSEVLVFAEPIVDFTKPMIIHEPEIVKDENIKISDSDE